MGKGMYFDRSGVDTDSTSSASVLELGEGEPARDALYEFVEEIRLGMPNRMTDMEELQVVAAAVALAKQLPDADKELARIRQLLKESMPEQFVCIEGRFYFLYEISSTRETGIVSKAGVFKRFRV